MRREAMMLRTILASPKLDKDKLKEYLIRLMYVEMLGHDASFGYIHAVKATTEHDLSLKRVAYLATAQFLDEHHDLIILIVNTVQQDLKDDNYLVVCAALTTICRLVNEDTIPAVLPQVTELLNHPTPHVRKKAVMALHRFHRRAPSSVEHLHGKFRQMLCDKDPSVMSASLCALYDLIVDDPKPQKNLVPSFVSILKQIVEHRLPKAYDYHRAPAPFLQVKLLKILAALGAADKAASEEMYSVLSTCLRKAETAGSVGNAIVYECVRTASTIYPSAALLERCAAAVSRFLSSPSNNLKYVGLDSLSGIVNIHPRYAAEHQMAVVDCLTDPDESLRKKTLDLMYAMTKAHNVEVIVEKMLAFLADAHDAHLREETVTRIGALAERYAPNTAWFIATMNEVFAIGGDVVKPQATHNLMRLIGEGSGDRDADASLRADATRAYAELLRKPKLPKPLLEVIVWTLGEYGGLLPGKSRLEVMDLLCDAAETQPEARALAAQVMTACAKLAVGGAASDGAPGLSEKASRLVERNLSSEDVDRSQRAHEIANLMREDASVVAAALPLDASGEDVDVGAAAPSLEAYVNRARQRGAAEYRTESERARESERASARPPADRAQAPAPPLVSAGNEYVPSGGAPPAAAPAAAASGPTLRIAQGSWGDAAFGESRPAAPSAAAPPRAPPPPVEPEPPDERSMLANALFSGVAAAPPSATATAAAAAASPAPAPEMDLLMGLDAPSPAASAAPVPDLLGGFDQLSVGGGYPGVAPAMMTQAPPLGMGVAPIAPGGGQVEGMGGMAPRATSSIPAHLRDRTPKKKSDPFADLLG